MSSSLDDPTVLAGEYVLGLLDPVAMRQVDAQVRQDPILAAEVVFWEDSLAPLSRLATPIAPPGALWSRLALATGIGQRVAKPGQPRVWQATTAAAVAIAACFAYLAFLPHVPGVDPLATQFVASLGPLNAGAQFLAQARADGSIAITRLIAGAAPTGRSLQLWELPKGATRPVSLGVLAPGSTLVRPPERALSETQLLVSDEPAGGSPTGLPTGPVLFGGALTPVSPATEPGR